MIKWECKQVLTVTISALRRYNKKTNNIYKKQNKTKKKVNNVSKSDVLEQR